MKKALYNQALERDTFPGPSEQPVPPLDSSLIPWTTNPASNRVGHASSQVTPPASLPSPTTLLTCPTPSINPCDLLIEEQTNLKSSHLRSHRQPFYDSRSFHALLWLNILYLFAWLVLLLPSSIFGDQRGVDIMMLTSIIPVYLAVPGLWFCTAVCVSRLWE